MNTVRTVHVARIAEVVGDLHPIAVTAGPKGEPVILASDRPREERWHEAEGPRIYRIYTFEEATWRACTLEPTIEYFSLVQPLPGDRWVLARWWPRAGSLMTVWAYDGGGKQAWALCPDGGIQDMQTTADGQIWLSYGDQGATTTSGLVALDRDGRQTFSFDGLGADAPPIVDCYALNVLSNEEAWVCYYAEFPIVRLVGQKLDRVWQKSPIEGASAFAVLGNRLLFSGTHERPGSVFAVTLPDPTRIEMQPVDPRGHAIQYKGAFARGPRLYLRTEEDVYLIDLRQ